MLGFTVRHKSNNWTVIGVNYSESVLVIHDPAYDREESIPLGSAEWVYRTPDGNGDIRYYGREYVPTPFSMLPEGQSWRTYYPQSSGASFIGEELLDRGPDYRRSEWRKGIVYIF